MHDEISVKRFIFFIAVGLEVAIIILMYFVVAALQKFFVSTQSARYFFMILFLHFPQKPALKRFRTLSN